MTEPHSLAVSAELLRRHHHHVRTLVDQLGCRLEQAMPDRVDFERSRLRSKTTLAVRCGNETFRIRMHGRHTEVSVDHIVRDVCLRSEHVGFDDWFDRLVVALEREAERSTELRLAIEDALS